MSLGNRKNEPLFFSRAFGAEEGLSAAFFLQSLLWEDIYPFQFLRHQKPDGFCRPYQDNGGGSIHAPAVKVFHFFLRAIR